MESPPEKEESGPPIGAGQLGAVQGWWEVQAGSEVSALRGEKAEAQSTNGLTFEATDWGREVSMCSEPVFTAHS